MHRNTAIVLALLAVIAALVVGLRIGRGLGGTPVQIAASPSPLITQPSPLTNVTYTHNECQISLVHPSNYQLTEASDSAILVPAGAVDEIAERIVLLCGVDFPKPPLPPEKVETATISGQRATVYHDASAKDGAPVDVVVFKHPITKKEIALFGFGDVFEKILDSLRLP